MVVWVECTSHHQQNKMRYVAAYLLAVLGGNPNPTVASIEKILASVGIECDQGQAQYMVDACNGRDVEDIIAQGLEKIEAMCGSGTPSVVNETNTTALPSTTATPAPEPSKVSELPGGDDDPNDMDMVRICVGLQILTLFFDTYFPFSLSTYSASKVSASERNDFFSVVLFGSKNKVILQISNFDLLWKNEDEKISLSMVSYGWKCTSN